MRQHVVVYWNQGLDFTLHAEASEPMPPDQARAWHGAIGKPVVRVDVPSMTLTC